MITAPVSWSQKAAGAWNRSKRERRLTRLRCSIKSCCILLPRHRGRTSRCWSKCARWLCRRSSGTDRSKPGLSTIRLFQSAGPSRSACSISIAGSWASKPICQVLVPWSIPNHQPSLPIAYRLYLPEKWAKDAARRKKARVPKAITFKTKPEIRLEQIAKAYAAGVPRGAVLIDASYGSNSALRTGISALGLKYVAAVIQTVKVRRVSDRGALDERLSAKELALSLPKHAW